MNVYILATARNRELLAYSTLVFNTLRIGFPNADVTVFPNILTPCVEALDAITAAANLVGATVTDPIKTIHHKWIEKLVEKESAPFWLLDTDVIFYDPVEHWKFDAALAGWRIPEFRDEFTGAITRGRLHTSLLYVDPIKVAHAITCYREELPETVFNPMVNLFHPLCLPFKKQPMFYDTCAMLYHAIGGQAFTEAQLDAYFHFNFGTISDVVLPLLKNGKEMSRARASILENPARGRGMWRSQMEYYQSHPI